MHSDLCVYWASANIFFFSAPSLSICCFYHATSSSTTVSRRRLGLLLILIIGINLSTSRHKKEILCWSLNRWSLCVFFLVFFFCCFFNFVYEANQRMYIKIIVKIIIYCLNCTFTPHRFTYCGLACDFAFQQFCTLYRTHCETEALSTVRWPNEVQIKSGKQQRQK